MENGLIQFGESHKEKGMTSLEIAKVTGKRHTDVLRDLAPLCPDTAVQCSLCC